MSAVLIVSDLSAGYSGMPVVRDVTFTVAAGEIVALLGPNGAGKTTLLRTVAGLQPALGGSAHVLGAPADPRHPHRAARRGVALVADDRALFGQLSVRDNLRLALPRRRRATEGFRAAYEQFPRLADLRSRRAGLLSGGEQQMLALARALVRSPRLLLVDELSLGLAPIVAQSLLPAVRAAAQAGAGVVLVEQHVDLALEVADRVLVLVRGRLELDEPAAAMRRDVARIERAYLGDG